MNIAGSYLLHLFLELRGVLLVRFRTLGSGLSECKHILVYARPEHTNKPLLTLESSS